MTLPYNSNGDLFDKLIILSLLNSDSDYSHDSQYVTEERMSTT